MIRAIKRTIARRNMKARGLRKINKADEDYTKWKSFFSLHWCEYLVPKKK